MKALRKLFLEELGRMYYTEEHIARALPEIIKAVECNELKSALEDHLEETGGQIEKVKSVFAAFDERPKSHQCAAIVGLIDEGAEIISENRRTAAVNAAIICATQKIEHFEIASYGCLHAWANLLDNDEAADILEEILEEEKSADTTLNNLASRKNEEALAEASAG
jgi:ferritin-like metal-binding protein YciE